MAATPFPNQPPPYEGRDLYATDAALREAVERDGAGFARDSIAAWGAALGQADVFTLADDANRHSPVLRTHDARGERIDAVEFHPAWHRLMQMATAAGEHCAPWTAPGAGAQVARAAMYVLHAQVENGTQCPVTMTYASVPALRASGGAVPGLECDVAAAHSRARLRSASAAGRGEARGADRHGDDRATGRVGRPQQPDARRARRRRRVPDHRPQMVFLCAAK
jgi:hypothetical protein